MAISTLQAGGFNPLRGGNTMQGITPPSTGTGNQNHITTNQNIRNAGQNIASAIEELTGRNTAASTLEGRTNNADAATVRVDNARTIASMPPRDTVIDVQQTAVSQTNTGDALASSARAVDSGAFTFEIEAGGQTHTFNINMLDSDSNASVQQLMARAINSRNIGVTASVATGTEGGTTTSALTLTANRTGTDAAFTVRDVTGNLAESMGVDTVTREARNAVFTVDGGTARTSQSNDISIAAGVTATLQGEGRAEISFGRNAEQAISAARDLVSALNSAMQNTRAGDGRGSSRFLSDLHGLNRTFESSLARIGIDVQDNGQLSINQSRLEAAAQDGSLGRFFDNASGFAGRVERIAFNATNTRSYANAAPPVNVSNNNFNFGNTSDVWSLFNTAW